MKKISIAIAILFIGCSSKKDFYQIASDIIQDDSFCTNSRECKYKTFYKNKNFDYLDDQFFQK